MPHRMFALRLTRSPYKLQARQYRRRFLGAGLVEHQIALPSASVRCWIGGEGPPLLLLQGFGANATWQWYGQVGHFASSRRLLVPDLLHFGGSVPRKPDCTLEAQVGMIRELLDQQGIAVRTGHHCAMPLMDLLGVPGTVRASFSLYNDEDDVAKLVAGVRKALSFV